MRSLVIRNASIVNEGKIFISDLLIKNGHIENINPQITIKEAFTEINGEGKYLLPGIIDDHVHFREPGLTQKATIYSESKAAIAGGVTSFMEMPNSIPAAVTHELLEQKYQIAQTTSLANFSFYLGATNENLEEIKRTDAGKICGVKIFMGSSTGQLLVDDTLALENIFRFAPALIAAHCETEQIIKLNEQLLKDKYGLGIPITSHPVIRNEEECFLSSKTAIELANKYDSRLHVLHISTEEETALFSNQTLLDQKKITAEACVHYLWFTAGDYDRLGPQIKCNPAIKESRHRDKLLQAIIDDRIDLIATDHAPHTWDEKYTMAEGNTINYFKSPSGLPLIQHSLNIMVELYRSGKISLEKIVEKMCHAPATLFRVKKRGFIREGYFADLVLLDLNTSFIVKKENILYKCGWSPLENTTFHGSITHTFVNGRLVFANGLFDESINGMRLLFNH
ncbi:MAG: dihydroorotase [Chitinophagales bacterium]|nr:dihydroorotase [Chitinophagales bacterium]